MAMNTPVHPDVQVLGRGAGDVILEHAFEAGRVQRVEAAVEHLSTFGSGYTAVTDEAHGVCRPEKTPSQRCLS